MLRLSTGNIETLSEAKVSHQYWAGVLELGLKDQTSSEKEKGLLLRFVKRLQAGLWSMVSRLGGHNKSVLSNIRGLRPCPAGISGLWSYA